MKHRFVIAIAIDCGVFLPIMQSRAVTRCLRIMTNKLDPYENDKDKFLDLMTNLRPDLFMPIEWTSEQKAEASEMVRPNKIRTALFASIPLRCRGSECRFASICPLLAKGLAPVGSPCPIEMAAVQQFMTEYINELGVDPSNLVEVSMIRDMVDQEIQHMRTTWLLSMEDFIQENAIGVSDNGEVILRKELHLAVEMQDRLHKRKKDLRNQLLATREAKAKIGQGNLDTAQSVSKMLEKIREMDTLKEKEVRKRLGLADYDDYIDAKEIEAIIVEDEEGDGRTPKP